MTFFYAAAGGLDHRAAAYLFRAAEGGRGVSVPLSSYPAARAVGRHICSSGPPPRCGASVPRSAWAAHLFPSSPAGSGASVPFSRSGAAHLFSSRPARRTCSSSSTPGGGTSVPFSQSRPRGRGTKRRACSLPRLRCGVSVPRAELGGTSVPLVRTGRRRICSFSHSRPGQRGASVSLAWVPARRIRSAPTRAVCLFRRDLAHDVSPSVTSRRRHRARSIRPQLARGPAR
jgi:hypothetical protein